MEMAYLSLMGRMSLPVLEAVTGPVVADHIEQQFDKLGIKQVFVSHGVREPASDRHLGGITQVPFLVWWTQGRVEAMTGGSSDRSEPTWQSLQAGDCLLVAPGSYIQLRHQGGGRYLRATVDTDHLLVGEARVARAKDPHDLRDWLPMRGSILSKVPSPELVWRCLEPTVTPPHRVALIQAWWWEVAAGLRQRTRQGRAQATWSAMQRWVDEHAQHGITRTDVAKAFGVHPHHVSRLFHRFSGATFAATGLRARLDQVRTLLVDSDLSVQSIAERCRFSSPSHLVRSFREAFGVTPGVWRRRHRA
jgi:AraC-like DNA-binding protein